MNGAETGDLYEKKTILTPTTRRAQKFETGNRNVKAKTTKLMEENTEK